MSGNDVGQFRIHIHKLVPKKHFRIDLHFSKQNCPHKYFRMIANDMSEQQKCINESDQYWNCIISGWVLREKENKITNSTSLKMWLIFFSFDFVCQWAAAAKKNNKIQKSNALGNNFFARFLFRSVGRSVDVPIFVFRFIHFSVFHYNFRPIIFIWMCHVFSFCRTNKMKMNTSTTIKIIWIIRCFEKWYKKHIPNHTSE